MRKFIIQVSVSAAVMNKIKVGKNSNVNLLTVRLNLAVNFSLIMSDVIAEVLSYLFTGKAINELFTGRIKLSFPMNYPQI